MMENFKNSKIEEHSNNYKMKIINLETIIESNTISSPTTKIEINKVTTNKGIFFCKGYTADNNYFTYQTLSNDIYKIDLRSEEVYAVLKDKQHYLQFK
jgi:hypothetical protein